ENHVAGVLLEGVVDRTFEIASAAVVVDAEAAADVHVTHRKTEPDQFAIKPGGFDDGVFNRENVGDLGADVEVKQLQRIREAGLLQIAAGVQDLFGGQAELGLFSGGGS